jgi:hypothetical protein
MRNVEDLDAVVVALGPARVHAQQHLGEVRGVDATGLRADGDQRVALVVFTGQQRADLEARDLLAQLRPVVVGVGLRVGVVGFLGELVEQRQVVQALAQVRHTAQLTLLVGELAGDLLRLLLVVPEVGLRRLLLQVRDSGAQPIEVHHRLDARKRGGEVLDVCFDVRVHAKRLRQHRSQFATGASLALSSPRC